MLGDVSQGTFVEDDLSNGLNFSLCLAHNHTGDISIMIPICCMRPMRRGAISLDVAFNRCIIVTCPRNDKNNVSVVIAEQREE